MKIKAIHRKGYTMICNVFEPGIDFDPCDGLVAMECLARYTLHDGYRVWKIGATYAKHMKPTFYYVVSDSRAAAVSKFLDIAPWLNVIKSVELIDEVAAEVILNNPARFILW